MKTKHTKEKKSAVQKKRCKALRITIILILTLIINFTWAQTPASKVYCQGCCSCITSYYLKFFPDNSFELMYAVGKKDTDRSAFGIGTYIIDDGIVTLLFDDIAKEEVILTKTRSTDSLIIHFEITNTFGVSVFATNVTLA